MDAANALRARTKSTPTLVTRPADFKGGRMLPYITHDPRFSGLVIGHANLEKLASGCRWAEGPAYFAAGRYLVWSDIPNNRMMRFDETDSSVSVFRSPSFNSNGNTVDRDGRLISCEHFM